MTPHSPPINFPSPSEYAEHQELIELMAEDRRRAELEAAGVTRVVNDSSPYDTAIIAVALSMHDAEDQARRLRAMARSVYYSRDDCWSRPPRWWRRAMTRIANQHAARARYCRRALVDVSRPARPVIKKGLKR